jgi:hypothetical protein
MRAVYTERSLPDNWYPERQLIETLSAHSTLQLESKVRGLALRTWRPELQSSHTGIFPLAAVLNYLNYWSNIS